MFPCSLGNRGTILRPAVFEGKASEEAPLLLSLSFLMHCNCELVLSPQEGLALRMQGVPDLVPLHIGPSGALRIPLQQFSSVMISGIKKLQPDKQNQHEHEFEILNLDDAAELSAQAQVRITSSSSPVSEPCHGTGTQARSWSASFNAAQQKLMALVIP